jgi:glutamate dehydrogenase (NADP+)
VRNRQRGRVSDYATRVGAHYLPGGKPWQVPVDVALPCATQNELDADDARALLSHGVRCVAEGANMPCTLDAVHAFEDAGILFAPGKAANAGGVATSGLEMSQNAQHLVWTADEVATRLEAIMRDIHDACVQHVRFGQPADGRISYVDGANIAGFVKVADAMRAQGVV